MSKVESYEELKAANAYTLASMAECGAPDKLESPGAYVLAFVRNSVVETWDNDGGKDLGDNHWEDLILGIANDAPSVYTHTRWLEFVDLCAYSEWEEASSIYGSQLEDLDQVAHLCLCVIAERLAHACLEALKASAPRLI